MSHGTVSLLPIAITQKSFRLMAETSYCHKFLYNYYSAAFVRQNLCMGLYVVQLFTTVYLLQGCEVAEGT